MERELSNKMCEQIGRQLQQDCAFVKDLIRELPGVTTSKLEQNVLTIILKGKVRFNAGDYFSALLYYSLALWYACIIKQDSKNANTLKNMVRECRMLYETQLKAASRTESDTPKITASSCKGLLDETTDQPLTFRNIVGLQNEKRELHKKFIYPFMYPQLFYQKNNNVLLYGPPGVGKTYIAKACVCELDRARTRTLFFNVAADDVRSKWEGGTEKNIQEIFSTAQKAAEEEEKRLREKGSDESAKSILFLDEVEAIAKSRAEGGEDRAITTLLQQMGGFQTKDKVLVIAATNYPWKLDSAFRRRFSSFVFIDLPDFVDRFDYLAKQVVSKILAHAPELLCNFYFEDDLKHDDYSLFQNKILVKNSYRVYPMKRKRDSDPPTLQPETREQFTERYHYSTRFIPDAPSTASVETGSTVSLDTTLFFERYLEGLFVFISEKLDLPSAGVHRIMTTLSDNQDMWVRFLRFVFFIALYTGPSEAGYESGFVLNRCVSEVGSSYFGYSMSDLRNVVNEFFAEMAMNIISSRFEEEKVSASYSDGKCRTVRRAYKKTSDPLTKKFTEIERGGKLLQPEILFLDVSDMYATVYATQLFRSVNKYPTTVGNDSGYCDYVCYQRLNEYQNCTSCLSDLRKAQS